ncbi:hypothetical protein L596_020467 [Steinernema carpocapsae]|uniref:Uncharacterized protein n=1 Tax=Steinernema carpocapsae TaxID=34508 RepID=A0A4U5MTU3_STECR|nr:hypothetical protein L596_020467 [Steinernema carpocapsae]
MTKTGLVEVRWTHTDVSFVRNRPKTKRGFDVRKKLTILWRLATWLQDGSVACHHRERDCVGNRHINCAFQYLPTYNQKNLFFYYFMNYLLYRGRITDGVKDCFTRVRLASTNDFVL